MKKLIIVFLFVSMLVQNLFSQADNIDKNTLYLEVLGSAGYLYNFSYDRIVYNKDKNHLSLALGVQFKNTFSELETDYSFSPQVNYFYGIKHHFETGAGLVYFTDKDYAFVFRLGYRFQKPEGGFFTKVGFTPLLTNSVPFFGEGALFIPWGGFAVGWAF